MRAFCTVSAPLEVCASSAEQLSPGSRFLALRLLGNQQPKTLYFLVDAKSRVREVYKQTCLHFATQGMLDTELFGLAVLIDGEYMFADPESKLSKYGPKSWRSSHTHGLDANGRPLLELHFRVQFYIESPFMLKDENSKHNYYLQLKYNALQRDIPREYSEQSMILLASLALQADFGDAPPKSTTTTTTKSTTTNLRNNKKNEKITTNNDNENNDDKQLATTTTTTPLKTTTTTLAPLTTNETNTTASKILTTTLPKISKRKSSVNERVLRLSTYVSSVASASSSSSAAIADDVKSTPTIPPTETTTPPSTSTASPSVTASSSSSSSQTPEADYFRVEDYLPEGLRSAWAVSALRACHRENRGMSTTDAELHYIQQACLVHEGINAHTFRMRLNKSETGQGSSWFVVYAKGIKIISVLANSEAQQPPVQHQQTQPQQQTTFLWPNITKLSFERKKFEIRSGESKITLYAASDEKNKMLLTLCKETHQFSMKIAARLKEVIKRDEEESSCLHACYIYSRSLHMLYKNKNDQRISVISSTSSNTTSGIVSDRVHSEDELEIMINTPPAPIAAPSTESLALAHLLDRPSVSRQTSSVGQVSLKDLEEQLAALSVRQAQQQRDSPTELSHNSASNSSSSHSGGSLPTTTTTATDSPSSQHNIGSQCSSTCSTVVVAASTTTDAFNNSQRRNSTSSSLELGFSHTAQNSTLSEAESTCIEHDFMASAVREESESVSGVYTLAHCAPPTETSGVYTMNSSELTGQSSEIAESEKSSHYGIFQPNNSNSELNETNLGSVDSAEHVDSVDGGNYGHGRGKRMKNEDFRLRSDSNLSTSGSFRGDGSDPTDNKHTLLSAKELTELIVGRGTYPNRKTVSSTLDSDCDYVTLPMPMAGESYIAGHQDTAPTEDQVEDMINDLLPVDPPAPPQRIDSTFPQINNMRMRSPPPYNARHEKTGLCGPPIASLVPSVIVTEVVVAKPTPPPQIVAPAAVAAPVAPTTACTPSAAAILRRRDPPPYPSASKPRPTSLVTSTKPQPATGAENTRVSLPHALRSEEVPARIITSRPQINILKAHTSLVSDTAKPSYAAPTLSSNHHLSSHLSQNSNYVSGSQNSLAMGHRNAVMAKTAHIPMVPYHNLHGAHKSMSALHHHQAPPPPPPYPEMKPPPPHTCVLLPLLKQPQYLPPPPPSFPRQPPPPPPNQLAAAVYGKQLELYQQQLYSDVDYVIYPLRDPAVSQQEYLDAKQGSLLAAMAAQAPQPPHSYLAAYHHHHHQHTAASGWDTCKAHAIYRSTPYLPLLSAHSRYASTQNLSDTYVQLPSACSPLYSPSMASLCSSFEPPPPPPLHPAPLAAAHHNSTSYFARSRSDDNILNSLDAMPKMKRLPPPPPPPYVNRRLKKPPMPTPTEKPPPIPSKPASQLAARHHLPPRKPPTLSTNGRSSHNPHMTTTSSGAQWAGERPKQPELSYSRGGSSSLIAQLQASMAAANRRQSVIDSNNANSAAAAAAANALDIALLREKSRHLDLPLISALCNDRSLLKQTKVLVNANKTTTTTTTTSSAVADATATTTTTQPPNVEDKDNMTNITNNNDATNVTTTTATSNQSMTTTSTTNQPMTTTTTSTTPTNETTTATIHGSMNNKINTNNVVKMRKTSNSHRHPNDKLPPLPMQLAEANNYVMDPAAVLKLQKSYNNNNNTTTTNSSSNNSN